MSSLFPAAIVFTCICGFIQFACIAGFFALRHRTVFAIRIPEAVLMGLVLKLVSFGFVAWMFLDPSCPCAAATIAWWLDAVANHYTTLREWVLVFRYQLQAALEKAKRQGTVTLDETNVYVRYRYILKTKWQWIVMSLLWLYLGLGNMAVLLVFREDAAKPCLIVNISENKAYLWTIIVSFIYCFPFSAAGIWSKILLKSFPKDNWKVYEEGRTVAHVSGVVGLVFLVLVVGVRGNDKTMIWHLISGCYLGLLNFVLPLRLWQRSVKQIAQQGLKHLASLHRLLKEPDFLIAFDLFLKSEFSCETLYFWSETDRLLHTYQHLLPADLLYEQSGTPSSNPRLIQEAVEVDAALVVAAAKELIQLTQQCIGEEAPWQVNIAGYTVHDIQSSITRLTESLHMQASEQQEQEQHSAVEEVFRCFMTAQREVYEGLRKDPYPRFSLTPMFAELNKNENLKRLLAAEHIELQSAASTHSPKELSLSSPLDGSNGGVGEGGGGGSGSRKVTQDLSNSPKFDRADRKITVDDSSSSSSRGKTQRPSFEVSVPIANANWEKHLNALNQSARLESPNHDLAKSCSSWPLDLPFQNVSQSFSH